MAIIEKRVSWTIGRLKIISWEENLSLNGEYEFNHLKTEKLNKNFIKNKHEINSIDFIEEF